MDLKILFLLITAALNFVLAIMVFYKNHRNKINIFFSCFVISLGLWSLSLALLYLTSDLDFWAVWWMKGAYIAAVFIAIFFYYFSIYFPYKSKALNAYDHLLILIVNVIILFIICYPGLLVKKVIDVSWGRDIILNSIGHRIFTIYFLVFFSLPFYHLLIKFLKSEGIIKYQLKIILWGLIITYFFGMLFNLILPDLQNHKYIWLGPYFSIAIVIYTGYLILKKK